MEQKHQGEIHSKLAVLMGERKWKLSEVITRAQVNRNAATNIFYERDLDKIKLEMYLRICDGLGVTLSDLLEYTPRKMYDLEDVEKE